MKKIIIIILLTLTTGCTSLLDDNCGCEKTTFIKEDRSTKYFQNIEFTILEVKDIECSEQVTSELISDNIYYSIKCNTK